MLPMLACALLLSPSADPAKPPEPGACKLLAKADTAVIHAIPVGAVLPGEKAGTDLWGPSEGLLGQRYLITHTSLKTWVMTKLAAGGNWAIPGPPMGIDRVTHQAVGLSAVASDAERLYVLIIRAKETVLQIGLNPRPKFEKVEQRLLVFEIAGGRLEQSLPAKTERLGSLLSDHVEDQGVLFVTKTGVRIGTEAKPHATFTRKDGKLEASAK